jgi:hypothetical protein
MVVASEAEAEIHQDPPRHHLDAPGKVANEGADSRPKPVSQNEPQATAQLSDNCLRFFDRHLREEHVTCLLHFFLDFLKSGSSAFYIC